MEKDEITERLRTLYLYFRGNEEITEKVKEGTSIEGELSIDPVESIKEAYLYLKNN